MEPKANPIQDDSQDEPLVERVAEEILERKRRGEKPTVEEYCEKFPDHAEELRAFLPALLVVEGFKPDSQDEDGSFGSDIQIAGSRRECIGDFRILRELGRGGMGIVYEAEQQALGRRVALKVLSRQGTGSDKAVARFQSEAKAAARMHHTNIVPVFDVGHDDECLYYAMQLIQGQSLDLVIDDLQRLRDQSKDKTANSKAMARSSESRPRQIAASLVSGQFQQDQLMTVDSPVNSQSDGELSNEDARFAETVTVATESTSSAVLPGESDISTAESNRNAYFLSVARIGVQTASALAYSHERGIIHRDIKPANLILDTGGIVWVTDFGLAKTGDQNMTHTGDILGTLRYMSPERFQGKCDVRADVYSLGLTLYEMLTLQEAFSAPDQLNLVEKITKTEPTAPRAIDIRIPHDLETIVLKSIDKDPRRRYQSADDMQEDLQRFINDEPIQARRASLIERYARWSRRNRGLSSALTALALCVLVITCGSLFAATYFEKQRSLAERAESDAVRAKSVAEKKTEEAQREREKAEHWAEELRRSDYLAETQAAILALDQPRVSAAEIQKTLQRHERLNQDLLDFPFHYAKHQLNHSSLVYKHPRNEQVASSFGPGGVLYTLSYSGLLCKWGESSDQPLRSTDFAEEYGLEFHYAELSPDGKVGAMVTKDQRIYVIDTATGNQRGVIDVGNYVQAMQFFHQGQKLAVCVSGLVRDSVLSDATQLKVDEFQFDVFDVASCRKETVPLVERTALGYDSSDLQRKQLVASYLFEISDDGATVVMPHRPNHTSVLVLTQGGGELSLRSNSTIDRAALSHDAKTVMAGSSSGEVRVFDATDVRTELKVNSGPIRAMEFSPDDQLLATGGTDGLVNVLDVSSPFQPEVKFQFKGHTDSVTSLRFDANGRRIVSATDNGTIRVWDLDSRRKFIALPLEHANGIDISPDGRLIATAASTGCEVWNLNPLIRLTSVSIPCLSCAFSPDSTTIAIGGRDRVALWKFLETANPRELPIEFPEGASGFHNGVGCVDFSDDGRFLAAGFGGLTPHIPKSSHAALVWALASGEQVHHVVHRRSVTSVDFSSDSNFLATAGRSDTAKVYRVPTSSSENWDEKPVFTSTSALFGCVQFSPDSRQLAFGETTRSDDSSFDFYSRVRLFDTSGFVEKQSLPATSATFCAIEFSSDGKRVIAACNDAAVRMWEWNTQKLVLSFDLDGSWIYGLTFSTDDRTLAAATSSGGRIVTTSPTEWRSAEKSAATLASRLSQFEEPKWARQIHNLALYPLTLNELIQERPDDPELKFALAEFHRLNGDMKQCDRILKDAIAACSDEDLVKHNQALAHAYADMLLTIPPAESGWRILNDLQVKVDDGVKRSSGDERGVLIGGMGDEFSIYASCPTSEVQMVRFDVSPEVGAVNQTESFVIEQIQAYAVSHNGQQERALSLASPDANGNSDEQTLGDPVQTMTTWSCGDPSKGTQTRTLFARVSVNPKQERLRFDIKTGSGQSIRRLKILVSDKHIPEASLRQVVLDQAGQGSGLDRLAVAFYLKGEFEKATRVIELAQANGDAASSNAPSQMSLLHNALHALILSEQADSTGGKRALRAMRQPRPNWVSEIEQHLVYLALRKVESTSERSAANLTDQLTWDSRLAFLREMDDTVNLDLSIARARELVVAEEWLKAAIYFEALDRSYVNRSQERYPLWMTAIVLYAYTANENPEHLDDYKRLCELMLNTFRDPNNTTTQRLLWLCYLLPEGQFDLASLPVDVLTRAVSDEEVDEKLRSWSAVAIALAAYRHGNHQKCVDFAEQGLRLLPDNDPNVESASKALQSLAYSAQGNVQDSAFALEAAKAALEGHLEYHADGAVVGNSVIFDHSKLIAHLLIQEAADAPARVPKTLKSFSR